MFLERSEIFFILLNLTQLLNFDEVYIMIYQPCIPDMHEANDTESQYYHLHKSKRNNKHNNVNIFYINKERFQILNI